MEKEKGRPLPPTFGKTPLCRLINVYQMLFFEQFGITATVNFPMMAKLWKPILSQYGEQQIACFLIAYFEFRGNDGQNEWTLNNLKSRSFPISSFHKYLDSIKIFLKNGVNFDYDNEEEVRKYLSKTLSPLLYKNETTN